MPSPDQPEPELRQVRAAAFDLYGTLLDVRSVEAACAGVAADPVAFTALWRAKQLEYAFLRTLLGRYADFWQVTEDALAHAAARHGLALEPRRRHALTEAWLGLAPFPEVPAALERLAARGLPLAVLSNGSPRMLEAALGHAGLRRAFAHVLSVDAVRAYKPVREVYEKIFNGVVKRLGMNPCPESIDFLYERYYVAGVRNPRASDCRDLLEIIQSICRFRKQPVHLTRELMVEAAASFICEFK